MNLFIEVEAGVTQISGERKLELHLNIFPSHAHCQCRFNEIMFFFIYVVEIFKGGIID